MSYSCFAWCLYASSRFFFFFVAFCLRAVLQKMLYWCNVEPFNHKQVQQELKCHIMEKSCSSDEVDCIFSSKLKAFSSTSVHRIMALWEVLHQRSVCLDLSNSTLKESVHKDKGTCNWSWCLESSTIMIYIILSFLERSEKIRLLLFFLRFYHAYLDIWSKVATD